MSVLGQIKAGFGVPMFLLVLWLLSWGVVHATLFALGVLTVYPIAIVVLVLVVAILLAIPFFPTMALCAMHVGMVLTVGLLTSGAWRWAISVLFLWVVGNCLLLWIRRWPQNWEKRNESSLLVFWQHQISIIVMLMCYLHPSLLGCLGFYVAYRKVFPVH